LKKCGRLEVLAKRKRRKKSCCVFVSTTSKSLVMLIRWFIVLLSLHSGSTQSKPAAPLPVHVNKKEATTDEETDFL